MRRLRFLLGTKLGLLGERKYASSDMSYFLQLEQLAVTNLQGTGSMSYPF